MRRMLLSKGDRGGVGQLRGFFQSGEVRFFILAGHDGVLFSDEHTTSCLDCGFLWGQIDEAKLEAFARKHCAKETNKEWGLSD